MSQMHNEILGYACAYTPLPLLRAAGFQPYRILPQTEFPDQAGYYLHDNICPHVKKILDRAMGNDLPELGGMVFMNSCDAMRRLPDAWRKVRNGDRTILVDLPVTADEAAVMFFAGELIRLKETLEGWGGCPVSDNAVRECLAEYNQLAQILSGFAAEAGTKKGGRKALHKAYAFAATEPLPAALGYVKEMLQAELGKISGHTPAIYLVGNILPDHEIFDIIETAGSRIVDEDLCTGSRIFQPLQITGNGDLYTDLARAILSRKPCARAIKQAAPGHMAQDILSRARENNAQGVILHTLKFCDPYLSRLSSVRELLRKENIPLLVIEGDCTTRSIGQHRTRLEAFIEMMR